MIPGSQRQQSMAPQGEQSIVICILVEPEPEVLTLSKVTPAQVVMQSEEQQHFWQQPQPGISGAYRFWGSFSRRFQRTTKRTQTICVEGCLFLGYLIGFIVEPFRPVPSMAWGAKLPFAKGNALQVYFEFPYARNTFWESPSRRELPADFGM